MEDTSHVTVRGLVMEATRGDAIVLRGCTRCQVVGCTIRNVGSWAVRVSGGRADQVVGCDITQTGAGGIGLAGGDPMLFLSDGRAVLTRVAMGEGKVFIFSDFYLFTTENMGHTGIRPDARQRSISELEYYMLRELLDMPQPETYWE